MMAKERTERAHSTECSGLFPFVDCAQGFAIVFQEHDIPMAYHAADTVEIVRISQKVVRQNCAGSISNRFVQLLQIKIQSLQIDINKFDPKTVLVERKVSRTPGYSGHNDLVT